MKRKTSVHLAVAALASLAASAIAQSGSNLQGPAAPQPPQQRSSVLPPSAPQAAPAVAASGSVTLRQVRVEGNQTVAAETLLQELGAVQGKTYDLAGLNALASRIVAWYRNAGYPFAQAWLPPQDLGQGVLVIRVLEGTYGKISAAVDKGKVGDAEGAQPFLDFGLRSGDPIQNKQLERTLLILDDQPGMKIRPILRPGAQQGQADMTVLTEHAQPRMGEIRFDNTGPRSTGEYRLSGMFAANSPFRYGDKVTFNGMLTNERLWLGSVDYESPIGASGLRGRVGLSHTSYQLGAQFAALDAVGVADAVTVGLSFPVVRSQATNVLVSFGLAHKKLSDEYRVTGTMIDKSSKSALLSAQFDRRDTLFGGGVTYGSLGWTTGRIGLDAATFASDQAGPRTAGDFSKINLDVARIQSIKGPVSAYLRVSSQWANKNLDSSEKFNLGGYYGVRAYPLGEGVGDTGWFSQLELRYAIGAFTPFVLLDTGYSKANAEPFAGGQNTSRRVGAAGVGFRYLNGPWSLEGTLAQRTTGGPSTADSRDRDPRLFFMAARRF